MTPAVTSPQMARLARQKALSLQQRAKRHRRPPSPTQPPHRENNLQQRPAAGRRETEANGPVQVLAQRCRARTCATVMTRPTAQTAKTKTPAFAKSGTTTKTHPTFLMGVLAVKMPAVAKRAKPKPRRNLQRRPRPRQPRQPQQKRGRPQNQTAPPLNRKTAVQKRGASGSLTTRAPQHWLRTKKAAQQTSTNANGRSTATGSTKKKGARLKSVSGRSTATRTATKTNARRRSASGKSTAKCTTKMNARVKSASGWTKAKRPRSRPR